MNVSLAGSTLALLALLAVPLSLTPAAAQTDPARTPLGTSVKVKQGMANVPALSPLWLLPEQAAKYNIQVEQVLFQRFADERTALASGDLDIAAFGPQDITLGLGQGAKSMIGVAGIGSGNDCLLVRKGEDIKEWVGLGAKTIGVGAGSISWLKFAASVQENGLEYGKLRIINIVGGGGNYLKSLQGKEIDVAVVWHPFCAQGIKEGWAAGGRGQRGHPLHALRRVAAPRVDQAHLQVSLRQRRHRPRGLGRDRAVPHVRVSHARHRAQSRRPRAEQVARDRRA